MRILRDLHAIPGACKGAVVALGNFEGVHVGHQAILRRCVALAREAGSPAAAMTFEPHPREFFGKSDKPSPPQGAGYLALPLEGGGLGGGRVPQPKTMRVEGDPHPASPLKTASLFSLRFEPFQGERKNAASGEELHPKRIEKLRIYPFRNKAEFIAGIGIDVLFAVRFNARFAALSAEAFIEDILSRRLGVSHVVTGDNFYFGQGRQGHKDSLAESARRFGFGYTAHAPVLGEAGQVVSSSAVRGALAAGDMASASALLGRPYRIEGRVRHGEKRGRALGFPTANIALKPLFLPKFGVYAARVSFGQSGAWHDAVANLGVRPTFGVRAPLLEAHCFDFAGDVYGAMAHVELTHYLREEKAFSSLDALKAQIGEDAVRAKSWLGQAVMNIPSPLEGEG